MTIEDDIPPVNHHPEPDDSECSYIVPISKDELYQELDELLTAFCSDAQQQFCVDQEVIEWDDLERIRQTVQQVQTLLPTVDRNNNLQLRRALARAIHDILQHYGDACQQRNMRLLDEVLTNQYIGDWHRLKQQWELKARENQHILLILDDITLLTQSWPHQHTTNSNSKNVVPLPSLSTIPHRISTAKKRSSTVSSSGHRKSSITATTTTSTSSTLPTAISTSSSTAADILTSILTTFDYPGGAYTVTVDKYNYGQLGLQHGKIGTRQIIFDSHQLSSSDVIETVNQICEVFASLFAATAHHHLAQIDAQVRKAQPFYTMTHIKRLAARIFCDGDAASTTIISEDALDLDKNIETDDGCPRHTSTSSRLLSSSPASSMAVLTPFRLSMTTPHMLWHHPIPIPSFAPAPWQLPDLLKPRHPYNPLFFGLLRRRTSVSITTTKQQPSSFLKRVQHQHPLRDQTENMPTKPTSTLRGKKTGYHRTSSPTRTSSASHATTTTTRRNASETICATDGGHASLDKLHDDEADNHTSFIHPSVSTNGLPRTTFNRTRHLVSQAIHGNGDGRQDEAPFTSVSVDKLAFHLGKMAGQFYQDLLMHTRLRYQETQHGLESLEWQMMDLYRHLQLASSRAVMQRVMMIVHELKDDDHYTQPQTAPQQHFDYGQVIAVQDDTQINRDDSSSSSSSSSSSDDGSDYGNTERWTPICTEKENEQNTPTLVYHSGTTTTSSASRPNTTTPPPPFENPTPCYEPTTDSSLSLNKQQSQMQQQQNNPALSITSSFTTAAS